MEGDDTTVRVRVELVVVPTVVVETAAVYVVVLVVVEVRELTVTAVVSVDPRMDQVPLCAVAPVAPDWEVKVPLALKVRVSLLVQE